MSGDKNTSHRCDTDPSQRDVASSEPVYLPRLDNDGYATVEVVLLDGRKCYPVKVNTRLISQLGQEEILEVIKREL